MKKALVVGIDYKGTNNELNGCVNDAIEMSSMLSTNGDGSPNFDVHRLISSEQKITAKVLDNAIKELFKEDANTVVLYFAGHGVLNEETNNGFLVTEDGSYPNWGVNITGILHQANSAYPKIKSTVILLDSCQSGFIGEISEMPKSDISSIGKGLTILTACHKNGYAQEINGHGKFTDIMLDGLNGASSDVLGRVTPAALYAHVDQTLGASEQRPIYKANVQNFITLRSVSPKVPKEIIRKLPLYFPSPSYVFNLDPSYEPDRGEESDKLKNIAVDNNNVSIFRELQQCNRHGLLIPTEHEHMWHSAVFYGGCRLTATGAYYRSLAEKGRI